MPKKDPELGFVIAQPGFYEQFGLQPHPTEEGGYLEAMGGQQSDLSHPSIAGSSPKFTQDHTQAPQLPSQQKTDFGDYHSMMQSAMPKPQRKMTYEEMMAEADKMKAGVDQKNANMMASGPSVNPNVGQNPYDFSGMFGK